MVELFLSSEANNITDKEHVRQQLNIQLKKMLKSENFIGKVDISRVLLVNAFWIATMINLPEDEELQQGLLLLLKVWGTGPERRFQAEEYERQHKALALSNLAKLYQYKTLPLFYQPVYKDFVNAELAADKSQEGSKVQLAKVFAGFIEHSLFRPEGARLEEQKVTSAVQQTQAMHRLVID